MGLPADSSAMSNTSNPSNAANLEKEAVIKNADMSEDMQQQAIEVAREALAGQGVEKDAASHIKKRFDALYGPTWHCIVGRSFGSFVTHEAGNFVYFYMRKGVGPSKQAILLFKAG